jgi:two-component system, OmpR family, phosphate regulon sensor histidine kinase PhoR
MTYVLEVVAIFLVFACGALWNLWRRSLKLVDARDQLWRNALTALAARDYESAGAFASMIEDEKSGDDTRGDAKELFVTLRRVMRTIESLEIAEREQQRARRDFEDILASLQDGVLVVDSEARLRYLNSAAVTFFGVRIEDVLGAQILEALPSFGLDAAVQMALLEGKPNAREVNFYSPRPREVFLRVAPVRQSDGTVNGAVAILQDLTEMRRLERVRRDFVANASHELRTPIATIRATAETILDSPDDPELLRRFLPHLVSEAERLSRLVSDLLDLARAESGSDNNAEITFGPVNLSAVTREVVGHLQDKADKNRIEILLQLNDEVFIEGDAAGLEQVIFNLVDNALIYTPAGGAVTLRISPAQELVPSLTDTSQKTLFEGVSPSLAPSEPTPVVPSRYVALSVHDTGIGIPAEDLERVFERFYRVDKARSRSQGGTGLGLAIVKHIVENHHGYVEVESEVGQGTTFRVLLPAP